MKLSTRMLIFVCITTITIFISTFLLAHTILSSTFDKIESDTVRNSANLMTLAINDEINFLSNAAKDWAVWDDTYIFIQDKNDRYIQSNIADNTFANLKINSVIIMNDTDSVIYAKYYDYINDEELVLSNQAMRDIAENMDKLRYQNNIAGIIVVDNELVVLTSHTITNSEGTQTSNGSMIFAKYLSNEQLEEIGAHAGNPLKMEITNIPLHTKYPQAEQIGENYYKNYMDEENLDCLIQLYDINNEPVAIVHMNIQRTIYLQSKETIRQYLVAQLIITIIISTIFFYSTKRYFINKINTVDKNITEIIETDDLTRSINIKADAEIQNLADNFKKLLSMLDESRNISIRNNEELAQANRDLQKLDSLKDNFVSNVSHELRTPLTSIKSYTQLIQSKKLSSKEEKEAVSVVLESTEQLIKIVNNLLDIARYESGNAKLNIEQQDIKIAINKAIKLLEPQLKQAKGKITITDNRTIKKGDIDTEKIQQVARNIISNAIKYRSDKHRIEIDIKLDNDNAYTMVSFKDNGIGIAKEDLNNLFNKFYQVDQTLSKKVEGSGLGLSIVKEIIKLHNGQIMLTSDPDIGTTLKIMIPLKHVDTTISEDNLPLKK